MSDERKNELQKLGFEVHRVIKGGYRYYGSGYDEYIVEFKGYFYRLHYHTEYGAWYKKCPSGGSSIFHPESIVPLKLKTKGKSSGGHTYDVYLERPDDRSKWVLNISNTPASWYLETLGNRTGYIYIDHGQDWKLDNYDEIRAEILEKYPNCALSDNYIKF